MATRRLLQWFDTIEVAQTLSSNGQAEHDLLVEMEDQDQRGATVTRMLLDIDIRPNTVNSYAQMYVGILAWPAEAFLAGIMPDADQEADEGLGWMFRGRLYTLEDTLNVAPRNMGSRLVVDLHSQRVLRTSGADSIYLILDQDSSGITLTYNFICRLLMRHR